MKKMLIMASLLVLIAATVAQAGTYTFTPYDNGGTRTDVFDFDHNYLYMWGINASMPSNERIVGASISIANINNWDANWNILKFYLLDNPRINDAANTVDIISIQDSQSQAASREIPYYKINTSYGANASQNSGKKFTDYKTLGVTFTDTNGTSRVNQFSYNLTAEELAILAEYFLTSNPFTNKNANIGLGFDPDCHFYNDGVTFKITTEIIPPPPVPEPASLLLFGLGLIGLAGVGRRMKK